MATEQRRFLSPRVHSSMRLTTNVILLSALAEMAWSGFVPQHLLCWIRSIFFATPPGRHMKKFSGSGTRLQAQHVWACAHYGPTSPANLGESGWAGVLFQTLSTASYHSTRPDTRYSRRYVVLPMLGLIKSRSSHGHGQPGPAGYCLGHLIHVPAPCPRLLRLFCTAIILE